MDKRVCYKVLFAIILITLVSYNISAAKLYVAIGVDTEGSTAWDTDTKNQTFSLDDYKTDSGEISEVMNSSLRYSHNDSYGNPFKVTWFIENDHAYDEGINDSDPWVIFENMTTNFGDNISTYGDQLAWHMHVWDWTDPDEDSTYHWNQITQFTDIEQTWAEKALAQVLIERDFFPSTFRTGWVWMDNNLSSWLEKWIPFDYSNRFNGVATDTTEPIAGNYNWSKAQWQTMYYPNSSNYQYRGDMERIIMGNIDTIAAVVDRAKKRDTIYFYEAGHTLQDISGNIDSELTTLESEASAAGINYEYVTAEEAINRLTNINCTQPNLTIVDDGTTITITSDKNIFGSQPFAAIKHANGSYERVNLTATGTNNWTYDISSEPQGYTFKAAANANITIPVSTPSLIVDSGVNSTMVTSANKFKLVFDESRGGEIAYWYDLETEPLMSYSLHARSDYPTILNILFYHNASISGNLWSDVDANVTVIENTTTRVKIRSNARFGGLDSFPVVTDYTVYSDGKIYTTVNMTNNYGEDLADNFWRVIVSGAGTDFNSWSPRADNTNDANGASMTNSGANEGHWWGLANSEYGAAVIHEYDWGLQNQFGTNNNPANYMYAQIQSNTNDWNDSEEKVWHFMLQLKPYNLTDDVDIDSYNLDYRQPNVTATVNMVTGTINTSITGDGDTDGFNEVEGSYEFNAAGNLINLTMNGTDNPKHSPVFKIHNYTATTEPYLLYDGVAKNKNEDFLYSLEEDLGTDVLLVHWLSDVNPTHSFEIGEDTLSPEITLISPINNSGTSTTVTFTYNVTDYIGIDNCSLIINREINQTETSITKDSTITFTLSDTGYSQYNWSINCTDGVNNIGLSNLREFSVVSYDNFVGDTTNLTTIDISNISNLVLESPNYGKINFSETVDLSDGADLNTYVSILDNHIEINSTALPALNKPARLRLYNLTYLNPRVLKDGSVCSDCTEVSYSGGTFVFDVNSFSVYSAEETPTTQEGTTLQSGSGGSITYEPTQEQLEQGYEKTLRKNYKIKFDFNNQTHLIKMNKIIDNETIELVISSEPIIFNLSLGEIKKVNLDNDSYYDLKFYLEKLTAYSADVIIKLISEEIPEEASEEEKIVKGVPTKDGGKDIFLIIFYFLIGLTILGLIFVLYLIIKKKKLILRMPIIIKDIRERRRKKREEKRKR